MKRTESTISIWNQEQIELYFSQWKEKTAAELAAIYGVSRKTINNYNKRFGLLRKPDRIVNPEGITYVPYERKKYKKKSDAAPVGTIQTYRCNGKLESWIVTETGREKLHLYNWKQAGNVIPEGYILGFKDKTLQNPEKSNIENLVLKTRLSVILENVKNRKPAKLRTRKPLFRIDIAKEKKKKEPKPPTLKTGPLKKELKAAEILQRKKAAEEKKRQIEQEKVEKKRKRDEEQLIAKNNHHNHRKRRKEPVFKTKPVDLSKLIAVKIDHRTTVFAKCVEDIPKIIARYSKAV
jgi:hypothetical protein